MPPVRRKGDQAILTLLGANLKRERKLRGITQEKLAEILDLHTRIVQKIEAGELNPKTTTLVRIQKAVGCRWEDLMSKTTRGERTSQ